MPGNFPKICHVYLSTFGAGIVKATEMSEYFNHYHLFSSNEHIDTISSKELISARENKGNLLTKLLYKYCQILKMSFELTNSTANHLIPT